MKITKQRLIDWATNLKAEDVELEIEFLGGGRHEIDGKPAWCCGYNLRINVGEADVEGTEPAIENLSEG